MNFHSAVLRPAVAAELRRTNCFCMCHSWRRLYESGIAMTAVYSSQHVAGIIATLKQFVKRNRETFWHALILILIGWSAYNIGLIQSRRGTLPAQSGSLFQIRESAVSQSPAAGQGSEVPKKGIDRSDLRVVVSKASSGKKYHHTWCASALRIKESNRLWFPSAEDAAAAGYSLAGNCTQ